MYNIHHKREAKTTCAEVLKSKCGYCGFSGYQGFENRNNRRNRTLYSKNIPTDFQGETILQKISTDFL